MIIELILAALAVTAAGGAYAAYRRRRQESSASSLPALMAPRKIVEGEILPNDVVVYLGSDYLVESVMTFLEGGRSIFVIAWLTDGDETPFLLIDIKEQPRCVLAEARDESPLGRSVPRLVHDEGLELRLIRRAAVTFHCKGSVDSPESGSCELGLYRGPGARKAAVVLSDDFHLFLVGRGVTEEGLQLLQGDLTRAEE